MKVTVVVLCYNSQKEISECLKSISAQVTKDTQLDIVVVDNDSSDDSVEYVHQNFPGILLIRNPTNMGYAGGNNTGLIYALDTGADYIWVINPDLTVDAHCLVRLLEGAAKFTRAGIFAPKIYFTAGQEFHPDRYTKADLGKVIWSAGGIIDWGNLIASHRGVNEVDKSQFDHDVEVDYVPGTCMLIKRQVLERIGLFDARYFLYFEENDFCQRAKSHGFSCQFVHQAAAWHSNAKSSDLGAQKNTDLQDYYITRNRILFGIKFAPFWTKQALLREAFSLYQNGRPWQKRAVLDFFTGRLGSGSYQPS